MAFDKQDGIGWSASIILHLLLLLMFTLVTYKNEPVAAGFVAVDLGDYLDGQNVAQALEKIEQDNQEVVQPDEPEPEPEQVKTAVEESKDVDLPDQDLAVPEEETVETPDTDIIAPEESEPGEDEKQIVEKEDKPAVTQGGNPDGKTGDKTGDQGEGNDPVKSAPFILEGLDRNLLKSPLPAYSEKVNAVIQMRITVDPQGRVIRTVPVRKGNAALDRSVMQALRKWRFNPLAPNVPQEPQTGVVKFTFVLR